MLHDEQHLVMVLAQRLLRGQQDIQMQIPAIGDLTLQISLHTGFDLALILTHGDPCSILEIAHGNGTRRQIL